MHNDYEIHPVEESTISDVIYALDQEQLLCAMLY